MVCSLWGSIGVLALSVAVDVGVLRVKVRSFSAAVSAVPEVAVNAEVALTSESPSDSNPAPDSMLIVRMSRCEERRRDSEGLFCRFSDLERECDRILLLLLRGIDSVVVGLRVHTLLDLFPYY